MVLEFSRDAIISTRNGLVQISHSACKTRSLYLAALIALLPCSLHAACHAVTPAGAGSKNGTNWSNAYAGIPGTLTRGDVYYFADGSYGSYTFSQATSGTTTIEFRKAQSYDYGRTSDGCSNDISSGWNASTMGASQAIFSSTGYALTIAAGYFILNGNGTSTAAGCGGAPGATVSAQPPTPTDCGWRLQGLGGTSSGALELVSGWNGSTGTGNVTMHYVELDSSGTNNQGGNGALAMWAGDGGNWTMTHLYGHNEGCVYLQDLGSNMTLDHSYFWGTEVYGAPGGSPCHGQAFFEDGGNSNGVISNNVWRDIIGTAVWTFAAGSGTNSNWKFYNNVVWYSSPTASWVSGAGFGPLANGVLACINSGVFCDNFTFVQNTIVNTLSGGVPGILDENGSTGYVIQNNLWYSTPFGVTFPTGTQNHNSFLNATTSCPSGTANVCNNSSGNPFTNWPSGDFTLASDGANWNNRGSLGSPYTTDAAGNTFTTDRGANQFMGTSVGVQPPSNLSATVQ